LNARGPSLSLTLLTGQGQGEAGAGELGLGGLELHHWKLTAGWDGAPLPNSPEAVNHEHEHETLKELAGYLQSCNLQLTATSCEIQCEAERRPRLAQPWPRGATCSLLVEPPGSSSFGEDAHAPYCTVGNSSPRGCRPGLEFSTRTTYPTYRTSLGPITWSFGFWQGHRIALPSQRMPQYTSTRHTVCTVTVTVSRTIIIYP
jgi:hypothetical protein